MDRYEIGDDCCGVVCYEETLDRALVAAQIHFDRHISEKEYQDVKIYDRLAHHGAPEIRAFRDGMWLVIQRRED